MLDHNVTVPLLSRWEANADEEEEENNEDDENEDDDDDDEDDDDNDDNHCSFASYLRNDDHASRLT